MEFGDWIYLKENGTVVFLLREYLGIKTSIGVAGENIGPLTRSRYN